MASNLTTASGFIIPCYTPAHSESGKVTVVTWLGDNTHSERPAGSCVGGDRWGNGVHCDVKTVTQDEGEHNKIRDTTDQNYLVNPCNIERKETLRAMPLDVAPG